MMISLELDKDTLLSAVQYKYAVVNSSGKTVWEFVPRKMVLGEHVNRLLSVPRDQIQQLTGMLF